MMGETYSKGVVLPSALHGAEVIDMEWEEIDKLKKQRTQQWEESWEHQSGLHKQSSNKRRDRNKQHEVENSEEQASIPKKDRNRK